MQGPVRRRHPHPSPLLTICPRGQQLSDIHHGCTVFSRVNHKEARGTCWFTRRKGGEPQLGQRLGLKNGGTHPLACAFTTDSMLLIGMLVHCLQPNLTSSLVLVPDSKTGEPPPTRLRSEICLFFCTSRREALCSELAHGQHFDALEGLLS